MASITCKQSLYLSFDWWNKRMVQKYAMKWFRNSSNYENRLQTRAHACPSNFKLFILITLKKREIYGMVTICLKLTEKFRKIWRNYLGEIMLCVPIFMSVTVNKLEKHLVLSYTCTYMYISKHIQLQLNYSF